MNRAAVRAVSGRSARVAGHLFNPKTEVESNYVVPFNR